MLLSAAAGEVKLWNPRSGACLRSIDAGQVQPFFLFLIIVSSRRCDDPSTPQSSAPTITVNKALFYGRALFPWRRIQLQCQENGP